MSDKALIRALNGECVNPRPIWLMRQAGRYLPEYRAVRKTVSGFLELCYTPEKALEVTLQPIRRYGFDASILFSDILVVPDALGADVRFVEGEGPKLTPIKDRGDFEKLSIDGFLAHLQPVFETVTLLRQHLPEPVTLIGFSGLPWTLAAYMTEGQGSRDFGAARTFAYADPVLFAELIDLLETAIVDYLDQQIKAGAETIQLFDSWAGVLPEPELIRWCVEPTRRIAEQLRARHPNVPVIAFPRGVGGCLKHYAGDFPIQGLSLDTTVPLQWAAQELRGPCLQGNLDPILLSVGSDQLLPEVDRILDSMAGRPFIFNLGHGILQTTNPDDVQKLVLHLKSREN